MKKKKCPKYVWYLPILHILFPLFFFILSISGDDYMGINKAVAGVGAVTALIISLFYYSSLIALKLYKKLSQLTAWFIFGITVIFPWFMIFLSRFLESSSLNGTFISLAILLIFGLTPFIFIFFRKIKKKR